jgi:hypothetical protein
MSGIRRGLWGMVKLNRMPRAFMGWIFFYHNCVVNYVIPWRRTCFIERLVFYGGDWPLIGWGTCTLHICLSCRGMRNLNRGSADEREGVNYS